MRIKFIFSWNNFWIGLYWDRKRRSLYILPIPMVGVQIDFSPRKLTLNSDLLILDRLELVQAIGKDTEEEHRRSME